MRGEWKEGEGQDFGDLSLSQDFLGTRRHAQPQGASRRTGLGLGPWPGQAHHGPATAWLAQAGDSTLQNLGPRGRVCPRLRNTFQMR